MKLKINFTCVDQSLHELCFVNFDHTHSMGIKSFCHTFQHVQIVIKHTDRYVQVYDTYDGKENNMLPHH